MIRSSGMFLLEQRGAEGRIFTRLPSLEDLSAKQPPDSRGRGQILPLPNN